MEEVQYKVIKRFGPSVFKIKIPSTSLLIFEIILFGILIIAILGPKGL